MVQCLGFGLFAAWRTDRQSVSYDNQCEHACACNAWSQDQVASGDVLTPDPAAVCDVAQRVLIMEWLLRA